MSQISNALAKRDTADRSLDASIDYARKLSASDLLPKSYQGKPQNVLLAVEQGRALGVDPITAINMIHVISGKPTVSAQLIGALIRRAGHKVRLSGDDTSATCEIIRSDDPDFTFSATWTYDRAQRAGLTKNPTWNTFRAAMLKARALTEAGRDACPEVLAGISCTAEEMGGPAEVVQAQTTAPDFDLTPAPAEDVHDAEIVEDELPLGGDQ